MKISKKQYSENGYTGLQNLGNTCFLNSCLQALSHTYELHDVLNKQVVANRMASSKYVHDLRIFKEWKELAETMWSGNGAVKPIKFVSAVQQVANQKDIEIFTGWAQNDVTEFLRFVVNCFHTSISRSVKVNIVGNPETNSDQLAVKCYEMLRENFNKEYSEIQDLFYGIMVSEISGAREIHSLKPEQYFILDLPIPEMVNKPINLYDCMNEFSKAEMMTGDNQWYNEKTGLKEDVNKKMKFWNFPKILVITLKRFTVSNNRICKKPDLVDFPLTGFDLSKYVEDYLPNKYVYDLYGICNHMGSTNGGHYTAFAKNCENRWIHYNDESVEIVNDPSKIITPMAYCFFYRMISR
jgi:ubiquitin carboxyl-terminal hydrolase 2/21